MKIALFGATGRVGRMLLDHALSGGHDVIALVRDPSKLTAKHARLVVRAGDARDPAMVREVLQGQSAALIALGVSRDPADGGGGFADATLTIATAMRELGMKRVVAIAGAGILLDGRSGSLRLESPNYPPALLPYGREHLRVYEHLRATDLDWTLVCPPHMPSGLRTGRYRTALEKLPEGGESISAEDVAAFAWSSVSRSAFAKKRVGIAY